MSEHGRTYLINPLTALPQMLIGELGRTTGMFLALFDSKMGGSTFIWENSQNRNLRPSAQVNGGSNYEQ